MVIYGFFKEDELVYIGQTRLPVKNRIWKHFNSAKVGRHLNMLIIRAIRKYGPDYFSWKVLQECNSLEELNISEMSLIAEYNPRYNISPGGVNGFGHSKESREKISKFQMKKIICIDDNICFRSVLDAESYYNAGKGTIGRVAAGKRKSYRGLSFQFIN